MALDIDYNSLTSGIVNYFKKNSTTIDTGMFASVSTIAEFRASEYVLWKPNMPAISVDLVTKEELREDTIGGSRAKRGVICTFEIGCHIHRINPSSTVLYQGLRTLMKNTEDAIRDDDTLSNTFDYIDIIKADFGTTIVSEDQFCKSGIILLKTKNYVTG